MAESDATGDRAAIRERMLRQIEEEAPELATRFRPGDPPPLPYLFADAAAVEIAQLWGRDGRRLMASEERAEPRLMTSREHALCASELAAAIQPATERFAETLTDPMAHTEAIATGAIKAHNKAVEHTIRMAELHARVADVLLRTEGMGP